MISIEFSKLKLVFANKYIKGFIWSFISVLSSKGSILIASFFVAQILGKSDFGKLGIIQSTIAMFGTFAGLGIGLTMTKYVSEHKVGNIEFTSQIITQFGTLIQISGLFFSILLFLIAPWLATNYLNSSDLVYLLRLSSGIIFFEAITGYLNAILSGLKTFKIIAKINAITGVIAFIVLVSFTKILNLNGAIIALLINSILGFLVNLIFTIIQIIKNGVKLRFQKKCINFKILFSFSLPALLSSIMVAPSFWICHSLLVSKTSNFAEIGIYNAAIQWRSFILFIPATLGNVVLPYLSSYLSEENKKVYNDFFLISLISTALISILVAIPLIFMAPWIMHKYGTGFENGYIVFDLIIISSVLSTINGVVGMSLISKGLLWAGFFLNLIWASILICSSYFFVQKGYGAIGLAAANLIAYFIHSIFQFLFIRNNLQPSNN